MCRATRDVPDQSHSVCTHGSKRLSLAAAAFALAISAIPVQPAAAGLKQQAVQKVQAVEQKLKDFAAKVFATFLNIIGCLMLSRRHSLFGWQLFEVSWHELGSDSNPAHPFPRRGSGQGTVSTGVAGAEPRDLHHLAGRPLGLTTLQRWRRQFAGDWGVQHRCKEANASFLTASLGMPAELLEGESPPRSAEDLAQQRG